MKKFDLKTLEMLVCPLTKTRLSLSKNKKELISHAARIAFPIKNNVALLYIEESRELSDKEYEAIK